MWTLKLEIESTFTLNFSQSLLFLMGQQAGIKHLFFDLMVLNIPLIMAKHESEFVSRFSVRPILWKVPDSSVVKTIILRSWV